MTVVRETVEKDGVGGPAYECRVAIAYAISLASDVIAVEPSGNPLPTAYREARDELAAIKDRLEAVETGVGADL